MAAHDKDAQAGTQTKKAAAIRREGEEVAALAESLARAGETDRMRLERIMDLLPCYVALIDDNHRVLFCNRTFEIYFGPPGEKPCYKVMRGLDTPCFFCPPLQTFKNRKNGRSSVTEWVHPDNRRAFRVHSYPFHDSDGTPCVLEAGFNITDDMRVQQALDLSEQSYRAITDNLSIGIALLDLDLRIKTGNTRLSQWFAEGFRLDRKICGLLRCGERWAEAEQGGAVCADCPFTASLKDGQGHEKELVAVFQDGKERFVRLVTCPVMAGKAKGPSGKIQALIMMLEDVTNRLRVNQQLQRARKLEAMNTLAGGIAHEINQPLSALHLYASGLQMLLEKPGELPLETTQERLGLVMREADKIRSIISHMRALVTKEGHVPLRAVSLPVAVANVKTIMQQQMDAHGVALELEVPPALPLVQANDIQLEQVLVNLFSNAIHAMDSSGSKDNGHTGRISLRAYILPETGHVRLEVADSGPGLPQSNERIFDPFFTTKERHEGMGLGLSIVHGLVSLWGGEISAASRHPELGGAVFYIDLRMAAPEPDAPGVGPGIQPGAGSQPGVATGIPAGIATGIPERRLAGIPDRRLTGNGDASGSGPGSGPGSERAAGSDPRRDPLTMDPTSKDDPKPQGDLT